MKATPQIQKIPRSYPALCASFPPRLIRTPSAYQATLLVVEILTHSEHPLNSAQQDYLALLRQLIERYETSESPKPLSLLRQLVVEHKLRKTDLSRILGRSLALGSMILNGQRKITREHADRLGKHFGLCPDAFLG